MEDAINPRWRKSSFSGNGGGSCVEVADQPAHVLVRDTQDRTGPVLKISPGTWRRFADQVKRSLAPRHPKRPSGGTLVSEGAPARPGRRFCTGRRGLFTHPGHVPPYSRAHKAAPRACTAAPGDLRSRTESTGRTHRGCRHRCRDSRHCRKPAVPVLGAPAGR
jgi:hypothetical protein